jgi:hypothetical protein
VSEVNSQVLMQRRNFLKMGITASAVIAVAGGGVAVWKPGVSEGRLSADGVSVLSAVAEAVLDTSLSEILGQRAAQLMAHAQRLDLLIAGLPRTSQRELSQLLALLASAPGRRMLTGLRDPWSEADPATVQRCLQRMRVSPFKLRQQIYHGLRELTNAAYYSSPSSWTLMGYPGPVAVQ